MKRLITTIAIAALATASTYAMSKPPAKDAAPAMSKESAMKEGCPCPKTDAEKKACAMKTDAEKKACAMKSDAEKKACAMKKECPMTATEKETAAEKPGCTGGVCPLPK